MIPLYSNRVTCFGINNEGQLVFDYFHEDIDQLGNANVYNGQNSVLWCNFRDAFPDKIKETYQNLRNNGYITFEKMEDRFITNGSDKWSESIYNEDSDFKYITMLRTAGDASNLSQVRGSGEEHFRYFIENRLNYCDSKWYASDYANDYISLRIYTPSEWSGVEPNAAITVTPFSNMYAGVRYKANGTLLQQRVESGVPVTFGEDITETFNDTETAIYGAHQLSSIGDLAPLYCGSVNVSNADKLIELKVGDGTEGYSNTNLNELSVGTNKLLRKVDVQNCPSFDSVLDLSNCPSIEEVYAKGSGITGVNFPEGGVLKKAQLPATITNFTLKHQIYVEELTFAGYYSIKTLWVEDCPTIDAFDILSKATNVDRLRLCGVSLTYDTAEELLEIASRDIGGIDENGANIDTMWIDGTCHIKTLTGQEYADIKAAFPYMTITYDTLTAQLIFMSEDGTTELTRQTIKNGGNGIDPVTAGTISKPTKTSTAQYDFTYAGWSLRSGGSVSSNALNNVEADRKVYAAFTGTIRSYTVNFYNGTTLLQSVTVQYGSNATYTGETPTNTSTGNTEDFEFYGWKPSPTNIQGNTNCYAQYHDLREITDDWDVIATNCALGTATDKYAVGTFKNLVVGEVNLPFEFSWSSAVVLNGAIHIMKGTSHYKWDGTEWTSVSTLPCIFSQGAAVVLNDEIHILGSYTNAYRTSHYKWDGTNWTKVSTIPYSFFNGSAVVLDGEIHILGTNSYSYNHYKWDGSEWTEVSTLPNAFYSGSVVVLNSEIHILGGYSSKITHYKWDGSNWTKITSTPYEFYSGTAVVLDGEIHILGSDSNSYSYNHYKWDGSEWTEVSTLPYKFVAGSAVVLNDEIHILGGTGNTTNHRIYSPTTNTWSPVCEEIIPMTLTDMEHDTLADDEVKWTTVGTLPFELNDGYAVLYKSYIHILGGYGDGAATKHYRYTGSSWSSVSTPPYDIKDCAVVVFDSKIHVLGGYSTDDQTKHYAWDGSSWTEVSTLPYSAKGCVAAVYNSELHLMGSTSTTSSAHYKWDGTEWTEVSTLPISFAYGRAVIYNSELHILGGSNGGSNHYKWNGTEWTYIGSLPFSYYYSSVYVLDDGIHMYGSYTTGNYRKHYKYDGTSWTSVETLPFDFYKGCCEMHSSTLYLLGGYGHTTNMISINERTVSSCYYGNNAYDDTAFIYENTEFLGKRLMFNSTEILLMNGSELYQTIALPVTFSKYGYIVWHDEIHVYGITSELEKKHYYLTSAFIWNEVNNPSFYMDVEQSTDVKDIRSIIYEDSVHVFIGIISDAGRTYYHYKFDGSEWSEASTTPKNLNMTSTKHDNSTMSIVVYNYQIHIFGRAYSDYEVGYYHFVWDGAEWTTLYMNVNTARILAVVYNDTIYISNIYAIYKWDGTEYSVVCDKGYISNGYPMWVYNNKLYYIYGSTIYVLNESDESVRYAKISMSYSKYNTMYTYNGLTYIHTKSYVYSINNPKSYMTFIAKNLLEYDMDLGISSTKSWGDVALRTNLNSSFVEKLPSSLQSVIKPVQKLYDNRWNDGDVGVSNDKVWIPSRTECGLESLTGVEEGEAYSEFTDDVSRMKYKSDSNNPSRYWTRTPSSTEEGKFHYIDSDGASDTDNTMAANAVMGVLIGFCI